MKQSLKFLLKVGLLLSLVFSFTISSVHGSSIDTADISTFIDKIIREKLEDYHIPNATVAVVVDGNIVLEKGYGYSDIDKQVPVDPKTTLFRIGSTSKLITWTAVMQLVEEGKLDLDTDVNNYLDFDIPAKLIKSSNKTEVAPITLRHLMTHTPGFENVVDGLFSIDYENTLSLGEYLLTYLPARVFPAGEVAAYSNYGSALAGYIVERVSRVPFEEYIEENIYKPLGMKNSTFYQPLPQRLSSNMARPYRLVDGVFMEADFEFMPAPAGAMSSTAADMAKFMIAHLQGGSLNNELMLKSETIDEMHKQQFNHDPNLGGMTFGFMEGYFNGQRTLFHGGATMMFNTGLYLLPQDNIGIFISYTGGNHLLSSEIFQTFLDQYYPMVQSLDQSPSEDSKKRSQRFIGLYPTNVRSFTTSNSVLSLMQAVEIAVDNEGYLTATYLGETNRFVEIEPGIYQSLREGRTQDYFSDFSTLVFKTDPFGRIMLASGGPMTYSKAPWYATIKFTVLALAIGLLVIILSFIYWIIRLLISLIKGKRNHHPKVAVIAKWTAIIFSILTLVFVINILSLAEPDPIYQLPRDAFEAVSSNLVIDILPMLMMSLGVALIIFSVIIWWKKCWKLTSRIHYTIFTSATLLLFWMFNYWNIL